MSPLLLNIVLADIPDALERVIALRFAVCADDITLWTMRGNGAVQRKILQAKLSATVKFLYEVGTKMTAEKSLYICIAVPKGREAHSEIKINIAGQTINRQLSVKTLSHLSREWS